MFITRATRHDREDVRELLATHGWGDANLSRGVAYIAREGTVVGCVRLIEVAPETVVVDDVLVAEARRRQGLGSRLMQTAMNSRRGTLYLSCHDDVIPFYESFGFTELAPEGLPGPVLDYMREQGSYPSRPDHVHRFMRAR